MQRLKLGRDSLQAASSLHSLGVIYDKLDRFDEAEGMFSNAMRTRELHLGSDSLEVASSLSCIALICVKRKQFVDAECKLKEVLRIQQLKLGSDSPDIIIADTLRHLAEIYEKHLNRLE